MFVPLISASTEARGEGYFRLEWKLAVDRSHLMADDAPFLFPVVIDGTSEATARVPEKFRDVQWTRLTLKATPESLAGRVAKLLAAAPAATPNARHTPAVSSGPKWPWLLALGAMAAIVAGILVWRTGFTHPGGSTSATAAGAVSASTTSEARRLAERARNMSLTKYDSNADDYAAAEGLMKRALELDPGDAEIWAWSSQLNTAFGARGFDHATWRHEAARSQAERALKLAPDSIEGRFALGRWQRDNDPEWAEAEKSFLAVLARDPEHAGALGALGALYSRLGRPDEARAVYHRMAKIPGQLPLARYQEGTLNFSRSHFAEAERCFRESVAASPGSNSVAGLAMVLLTAKGDATAAVAVLTQMPENSRSDHRAVWISAYAYLAARDPDQALAVLDRLSVDYIQDSWFNGPRAYWVGRAHAQAGRLEAARLAFESGLAVVDAKLKIEPDVSHLHRSRSELLAWLGRSDEAMAEAKAAVELDHGRFSLWTDFPGRAYAVLGRADDLLPMLEKLMAVPDTDRGWPLTPALLRIDPIWDKVRDDPRFARLAAVGALTDPPEPKDHQLRQPAP